MTLMKNVFELGKYATFDPSKDKPIYSWFYYKEAFSPEIVEYAFNREKITDALVFDPFAGIGTTLLAAKSRRMLSTGIDASPLAVFVSHVKCDNYEQRDIDAAKKFVENFKISQSSLNWDFELFSPRAVFPKSNLNAMLSLREQVAGLDEKPSNLLLLALLSTIPQTSLVMKDGGVLKIDRNKRAMPVKEAFRRKAKRMISDLENYPVKGPMAEVILGDARNCEDIETESVGISVTSPPYLNNIDYSKVYGLELSLLELDREATRIARGNMVRSFISAVTENQEMPPEVGEIGNRIPVIGTYFNDMELVLRELYRVLTHGSSCSFVVSNSIIFDTHVLVDEVIAEMAERIGFTHTEIEVCLERWADVRPRKVKTRESIVVFRK